MFSSMDAASTVHSISLRWSPKRTPSLAADGADARVERPLTPMSVAGAHTELIGPHPNHAL